jgi:hypothetical protein
MVPTSFSKHPTVPFNRILQGREVEKKESPSSWETSIRKNA